MTGPGISDSRINACKQFAPHPAFEESLIIQPKFTSLITQVINAVKVAFGEQTAKQWRTAKAGAIEVYDPFVETMEM